MDDDSVLVPPEVYDELERMHESDALDPDDREGARRAASERGYESAEKWIDRVDDAVYARTARGEFEAAPD